MATIIAHKHLAAPALPRPLDRVRLELVYRRHVESVEVQIGTIRMKQLLSIVLSRSEMDIRTHPKR